MRAVVSVPGYRIEHLLSWGSQGDVFRGTDGAGAAVAMKIVTADRCGDDLQAMERLRREARLLAAIDSPHVVRVRDFVQTEEWSCLVLEYLDGRRLDAAVRARGGGEPEAAPPSGAKTAKLRPLQRGTRRAPAAMQTREHVSWALDVALQLATGVAAMHRAGLIHRDLKPQNAMLVGDRVVLIDFGFARQDGVTTMTQGGIAIGTLAYMAPELLRNSTATASSDVHALGATLYQCLAGAPPTPADSTSMAVLAARRRPHDVRRANPAVDAGLAAVVTRCLEPDPRDRYPDAGAVLADLERVQRGEVPRAAFSFGRAWRHHGRNAARVAMLAAALLLIAWWPGGVEGGDLAMRIQRAALAGDEGTVSATWGQCDDGQRAQIAATIGRRIGADSERAAKVAKRLGLALLTVMPHPNRRIALLPAGEESPPPPVLAEAFVATDATSNLLVRPGRVWCFVMTTHQQHWWAKDDPWCLQLLLDLASCDGIVAPHSLAPLPAGSTAVQPPVVRFELREYEIRGMLGPRPCTSDAPFAMVPIELSRDALVSFRRVISGQENQRGELDFWLRHPDEPDTVGNALWGGWRVREDMGADAQPATASFWEAYRCAAWYGCRLPSLVEWQIASYIPMPILEPGKVAKAFDRRVLPPVAVDSEPAWDNTQRGVCFANSNVREWVLDNRRNDPVGFLAVPLVAGKTGSETFLPVVPNRRDDAPSGVYGIRLCRSLLPLPIR